MTRTGAEIAVEMLRLNGVDTVFGIPGGQAIALYDALARQSAIRHILAAHEQGACHAADGYARASGKTGVCVATSGPGATNLVTGIACAYMDMTPLVAVTVNVPGAQLGTDSFQEIDIFGVTTPITKHNFIVRRSEELAPALNAAFRIAQSGSKGPVLVDILRDVCQDSLNIALPPPAPALVPPTDEGALARAQNLLADAKRPMLLSGGGVIASGACDALLACARKLGAPVATTLMGIGAMPPADPMYTGLIGMHGTRATRDALRGCDVLLAVGTRFSDRVTGDILSIAKRARIVHIDIDDAQIDKNVPAAVGVRADARAALERLTASLPNQPRESWYTPKPPMAAARPALSPTYILQTLSRLIANEDATVCTDVGLHQIWAARHMAVSRPRGFLTSGGLGAMGFGLPAAIGAKIARPQTRAVLITGDGSFRMGFGEMATARAQDLPVLVLILDNDELGMVRQWQDTLCEGRHYQSALKDSVDYVKLAEAFSCKGYRISRARDVEPVLREALAAPCTAVVDARVTTGARR